MRVIKIGFSPCPNDTFIFDALVNNRIDTGDLRFEAVFADVQTLNEMAEKGQLEVTKLSYFAFFKVLEKYSMLSAGGALGKGVGPLLISAGRSEINSADHPQVALPGQWTTAQFLFSDAYPDITDKSYMPYNLIEPWLKQHPEKYGVIIHENRFTYAERGFTKIADLGTVWEQKTGLPIPLGGIAIRRDLDKTIVTRINDLIRESVAFAFDNPDVSATFVKQHSQELADEVIKQHIELYVNDFSLDLGDKGKQAVNYMFDYLRTHSAGFDTDKPLFAV